MQQGFDHRVAVSTTPPFVKTFANNQKASEIAKIPIRGTFYQKRLSKNEKSVKFLSVNI